MDASHGQSTGHALDAHLPESPSSTTTLTNPARKKALLIGIRTARTEGYPVLEAAHNDVKKMSNLLIEIYHYAPSDICVLIDDGIDDHVQPTRASILQAIADLVKDVKDGDYLFFHYSGHSTQVDNPRSNSEEDGKDECKCATVSSAPPLSTLLRYRPVGRRGHEDHRQRMFFSPPTECQLTIAQDLHAALVAPLPAGAHLVAVLDTCHSDLPHYRCNRILVPWLFRGKRTSEDLRHYVVRRGARLLSLAGLKSKTPTLQTHNAPTAVPTRVPTRRNVISVVCDPQELTDAPASPRTSSGCRRIPQRTRTLMLTDQEDADTDVDGPPAFAKLTWIEDAPRCESPVARFPCSGWCRCAPADTDAQPSADVISLASCKDSQFAWEDDEGQKSMTSFLVDILRENPNRSLREVLESISHATYTMAVARHWRAKMNKRQRKKYTKEVACLIGGLERGRRSTASLAPREPPRLAAAPTFPHTRAPSVFAARVADHIALLKQKLKDLRGGYDMDAFQNPELASPRPLDLDRPWCM
ncbi:caspase domain-containing protein [Mycena rosella]|uniref:Caspase domain-containing protein n=1 Tax=Mycena rosella TaxID=1033263 RepID=A0AAD7CZC7_MYCRO|nr:caspase domain-containing protein [Mycena rosella]